VKCCKEHKEKCPNDDTTHTNKSASNDGAKSTPSSKSLYLSSDALTEDPIQNAKKRRRMLECESVDDSDDEEYGWKISKDMMDRVDNSSWLRKELADGGLRQMVATIDNADWEESQKKSHMKNNKKRHHHKMSQIVELSPRELALERAKYTNPKFAKFVDRLLLTAGVLVDNGKDDDNENLIASLLNGSDGFDPSNLTLASIPSKRRTNQVKEDSSINESSSDTNDSDSEETSDSDDNDSESAS